MKVLIFGGTTEGRELSAALAKTGIDVTLSVATEFGKNIIPSKSNNLTILSDRLDKQDMIDLLKQGKFDYVIDSTHPYAVEVTQNIRLACEITKIKHLRLKRPESETISGIIYVSDVAAAVRILEKSNENVLLTIGSKELEAFTSLENFDKRVFVRILPMLESLENALKLGFRGSNIICMQGSFDKEMNTATLKMTGARYLITKDSGDIGGFEEKVSAARSLGCEVIVISRPIREERGYTHGEILSLICGFEQ